MTKRIIIGLISIAAVSWIIFSDVEWGKYDSFEEVLEKGIPYKVKNVIHTQNVDGVTVVMYTTEPDRERFPFADFDALAVAFLKGNDEDGWENIGPNGWEHYEHDNMTVYTKGVHSYDRQENVRHEFYVVFGEINNSEITKIETKTKQEETFEPATIIMNEGKRYYFQVGPEDNVRGLSKDGKVIDRQGG